MPGGDYLTLTEERIKQIQEQIDHINAYLKINVLWPEMLFATMALNDFIRLYARKRTKKSYDTDDPFRSVGIVQTVLLNTVISRMLMQGINQESVKSVIELVINSRVDRETLHSELIMELVKNLKST